MVIGLLGYIGVKYFSETKNSNVVLSGHKALEDINVLMEREILRTKSFNIYAQNIRSRKLFQPLKDKLNSGAKPSAAALPALHKRIKIIGILLDNDSKAIVEDLKEKQVFFLSKGEVVGKALLEDIQEDKVVFVYNNERVEMAP